MLPTRKMEKSTRAGLAETSALETIDSIRPAGATRADYGMKQAEKNIKGGKPALPSIPGTTITE